MKLSLNDTLGVIYIAYANVKNVLKKYQLRMTIFESIHFLFRNKRIRFFIRKKNCVSFGMKNLKADRCRKRYYRTRHHRREHVLPDYRYSVVFRRGGSQRCESSNPSSR